VLFRSTTITKGISMYARIIKFQGQPGQKAEMEARIDSISATVGRLSGMVSSFVMLSDDGTGYVVSVYETEAAATAALPTTQELWGNLADILSGPPEVMAFDNVYTLA